jgi:hypothetical protein
VERDMTEPDYHDVKNKIKQLGYVSMKKISERQPIHKMNGVEPHEKRFETYALSPGNTKYDRPVTTSLKQQLARDDKMNKVNMTPSTFNGNIEAIMPRLSKAGIGFEKILQRKPINNINKAVTNDTIIYDNIDRFFQKNSKFRRIYIKDLNKDNGRGQ